MKTEVILTEQPKFQPITLNIVIESKRELEFIWAIANGSWDNLVTYLNASVAGVVSPFSVQEPEVRLFHSETGLANKLLKELEA